MHIEISDTRGSGSKLPDMKAIDAGKNDSISHLFIQRQAHLKDKPDDHV